MTDDASTPGPVGSPVDRGARPVAWLCQYRSGEEFVSMAEDPMSDPDVMSAVPLVARSALAVPEADASHRPAVAGQVDRGARPLEPERDVARAALEPGAWKVQVFGERCSRAWEISVVRESNTHGRRSWGWFGEDKLLVSHNGGPCDWPVCGFVWDEQIAIATELCRRLNAGDDVSA